MAGRKQHQHHHRNHVYINDKRLLYVDKKIYKNMYFYN